MSDDGDTSRSHTENRLVALQALYQRYGREGMKDQPVADVALLLAAKELELRDGTQVREATPERQRDRRQLELEILDLHGYLHTQGVPAGLSGALGTRRFAGRQATPAPPRSKRRNLELER